MEGGAGAGAESGGTDPSENQNKKTKCTHLVNGGPPFSRESLNRLVEFERRPSFDSFRLLFREPRGLSGGDGAGATPRGAPAAPRPLSARPSFLASFGPRPSLGLGPSHSRPRLVSPRACRPSASCPPHASRSPRLSLPACLIPSVPLGPLVPRAPAPPAPDALPTPLAPLVPLTRASLIPSLPRALAPGPRRPPTAGPEWGSSV